MGCNNCNGSCTCKKIVISKRGEQGIPGQSGMNFYYTKMLFQPNFTTSGGYPLISGAATMITPLFNNKLTQLDMTSMTAGDYLLMFEAMITSSPSGNVDFTYELRKNGVLIPYSTRVGRIPQGTPGDNFMIGVNAPVTILATSDIITVWIRNFEDASATIAIIGGSLTALKK